MARYTATLRDQNQRPIPAALVSVTAIDGSTALLTDDSAQPLANPFPTDAYGTYTFNTAAGVYTIGFTYGGRTVLKEVVAVGTLVANLAPDPTHAGKFLALDAGGNATYSTGTGADAGLRTDLAASGGSALAGFLQSGTGAVSRSVQSKLRERVSARDFGATGDGTTNDAPAIQVALDYVGGAGGGSVFLPAPAVHYRITQGLKLPAHVTLEGPAPVGYPFNAGNNGATALVADFADFAQWVIEPKTLRAGAAVAYNAMLNAETAPPDDFLYNCGVHDLLITSVGNVPYGGIRMHGSPASRVSGVGIDRVGCALLNNLCFNGRYAFNALIHYYGLAFWDDCNGNIYEPYVARTPGVTGDVPAPYRLPPMATLSTALVATHDLATNAHAARSIAVMGGSLTSTSNNNIVIAVMERFDVGRFLLYAYSNLFALSYSESDATQMKAVLAGAQFTMNEPINHAYLSGGGTFFDVGKGANIDISLNGTVFTGTFGHISTDATTRLLMRQISPDDFGPTTPQFNIIHEQAGLWKSVTLTNATLLSGDVDPGYRRERHRTVMQGALTATSAAALFTIPAGYRPYMLVRGPGFTISTAGVVTATQTGVISFAGFSYEATQ
jgi:hypothetical protein